MQISWIVCVAFKVKASTKAEAEKLVRDSLMDAGEASRDRMIEEGEIFECEEEDI